MSIDPEALARLRELAETPAVFFKGSEREMIADLRALLDAHDTARAEGVAAERARVVADLRTHLRFWRDLADLRTHLRFWRDSEPEENLLGSLIDRYERGEHNKEGT